MPSPDRVEASSGGERLVVAAMAGGLVVYAGLAFLAHRWLSGLVAPLVAALLVRRHPRARFAAYVFLSALALRSLLTGAWPAAVFAAAGIAVLQTRAARRTWPRLTAGRTRAAAASTPARDCSRMSAP
jgi:hypothetical protein